MMPNRPVSVRTLDSSHKAAILPLLRQLHTAVSEAELSARFDEMARGGYVFVGAFRNRTLEGVGVFCRRLTFHLGPHVDLESLVVNEACRSRGVGRRLLRWIHRYAAARGCAVARLDTFVTNTRAQKFYLAHGYAIHSFQLVRTLSQAHD